MRYKLLLLLLIAHYGVGVTLKTQSNALSADSDTLEKGSNGIQTADNPIDSTNKALDEANRSLMQFTYTNQRLLQLAQKGDNYKIIMAVLQLHLNTSGQVGDVIELLESVEDEIDFEYQQLLADYSISQKQINNRIQSAQTLVDNSSVRLAVVNEQLSQLQDQIDQLKAEIEIVIAQVIHLTQREKSINKAREIDIITYAVRKIRDENSLKALQDILERLNVLNDRGDSFLEVPKDDIQQMLRLVPANDPARAFSQISSQFNAQKLQSVITLLKSVQNAIQQSYVEDQQKDEISEYHYNDLIAEVFNTKQALREKLIELNDELRQVEYYYKIALQEKIPLVFVIETNEKLIQQQKAVLKELIVLYEARIHEAEDAVDAVQQALFILRQHEIALSNREQSAENTLNQDNALNDSSNLNDDGTLIENIEGTIDTQSGDLLVQQEMQESFQDSNELFGL